MVLALHTSLMNRRNKLDAHTDGPEHGRTVMTGAGAVERARQQLPPDGRESDDLMLAHLPRGSLEGIHTTSVPMFTEEQLIALSHLAKISAIRHGATAAVLRAGRPGDSATTEEPMA